MSFSNVPCPYCRRTFIGNDTWLGHRVKIKKERFEPGEPRFRCMDDREFSRAGFTRLPDGEYIGGSRRLVKD
jgi:hypothetical protein